MPTFALYNQLPAQVLAPTTLEELADMLRDASAADRKVVPWGGGTRQGLGGPPTRYDSALDLTKLDRVVTYTPADLVISVEAGVTLGYVQDLLAAHHQWLPWNPPLPRQATIGGLLASGANGPLRLGYGTPRDWVLAMRVVLGNGRLVKSGAPVVKNVAGYDAHKLHIGALGTLGVIAEATFKVAPIPQHCQTLLASFKLPKEPLAALSELSSPPFQPISMVVLNAMATQANVILQSFLHEESTDLVMAVRFAGTAGAVARQLRVAVARCVDVGARTIELSEADDAPLWAAIANGIQPTDAMLLRVAAPPAQMREMMRSLEVTPRRRGWPHVQIMIMSMGLAYTHWPLTGIPVAEVALALAELRADLAAIGGYVVVEHLPAPYADDREMLDLWGPPPETLGLMQALRMAWDPMGILNPGRYLV